MGKDGIEKMGEIQVNGKVYENSKTVSIDAMAVMGYYVFHYFPKDKLIINTDSAMEVYQCKQVYTDMPYTFIDEFVDENYREQYIQVYQDIDAGAKKASVLFRMKKHAGMCKVTLVPTVYDADGKLEQALGLVEDVTDVVEKEIDNRRKMENLNKELTSHLEEQQALSQELEAMLEAAEAQNNLINALVSSYQDVYVINMNTGISSAYRMSSVMALRYEDSFAVGDYEKNIAVYVEKAVFQVDQKMFDSVRTIANIQKLFEERDSYSFTYREFRDGCTIYFQCQLIKPAKDRNEVIVALKDVDNEVREEIKYAKATKEQLGVIQALSNKYESVFLINSGDGTVIPYHLNSEKEYDYGKRFSEGLTWDEMVKGYARKEVHPDYAEEFIEKISTENLVKELSEKSSFIFEYKNNFADKNHSLFYQIKAVLMPGDNSNCIIAGVADVNEEREQQIAVQNALKDAYTAARMANNAKTDFLANMSHDIRTPMNAIIGMTAIAATHIDDQERVQDCLKKITSSSKHLLSLINEVLDMSKIESGKIDLAEEDFNLSELIDNLLIMLRPQMEAHHHELAVNIKGVEHEQVIGDSLRIQQVFVNIMSNAIKYTPNGGKINLSITEKPTNQQRVGFYEIVFEDNGIGMTEEFIKKLFEPFARAHDDRIRNVQGTGLGMVISKNIVNMMGGNIEVESELNKGTKFTVTFFLKLRDVEEIHYEEFVDLPVLVVDDDEISMESACCMLDDLGMKTEGLLSGREAVGKIQEHHQNNDDYFAVILDWKMPDMDGIETTKQIRKAIGNDVLIIIISAYDWSDIEQEARQAGANAFISKPLFKSRLAHLFHSLVGNEEDTQENMPLQNFEDMNLSGYRVLLVEDNELNAEIATEILEMTGITVDTANDGSVAVDMIREREDIKYDIILMDIQMPKMNGYDAARAIRNLGRDYCKVVPIIAMTANAFAEDVQAAFSAGMNEHIAKPLDLKVLADVLNKWILR